MNLGSLAILMLYFLIKVLVVWFLSKVGPSNSQIWPLPKLREARKQLPNEIYQNIDQTYLIVLIMAHINLKYFEWENWVWKLNTVAALLVYIIYLALPFHLALLYRIRLQVGQD